VKSQFKILEVKSNNIVLYEDAINQLLNIAYDDSDICLEINNEFLCSVLTYWDKTLIAHAAIYVRDMEQNHKSFRGAIIGKVAVLPKFRHEGHCKTLFHKIDEILEHNKVEYAFLFAIKPRIYCSLGYKLLHIPINFYDQLEQKWSTYIFRGSMQKCIFQTPLKANSKIKFKGRVY